MSRLAYKPLQIGDRIRLSGGHQEPAPWLQGLPHIQETVTAIVSDDRGVGYEVVLDSPLVKEAIGYRFALLRLHFADARWAQQEIVGVELWMDAPSRHTSDGGQVQHEYVESHAVYRVIRAEPMAQHNTNVRHHTPIE